jgi:Na+/proline symporter
LYAPSLVLSVILGWPDRLTTVLMGVLVVTYTAVGGNKAVTWADVQQMLLISCALVLALFMAVHLMPANVTWANAISLAGAAGKLNAVNLHFDWDDRYNLWSGLIGGMFLALAYFGCDQSQVQRYLTGKSIAQSRLSLLFNAMAKIPMQFFILFIGAMVFVLFVFDKPPLLFQPVELKRVQADPRYPGVQERYDRAFDSRKQAAEDYLAAQRAGTADAQEQSRKRFDSAQVELNNAHAAGEQLVGKDFHDVNFIFLTFVTNYLPVGVVGLVIAVIFTAAMSSTSGEINSLAAVTVIDLYQRHIRKEASDHHYLNASRWATLFWGIYAVGFAQYGRNFGALIETVNIVGSLFYGGMLGVFTLAFFFKKVGPNGAFLGVLAGEAAIFAAYFFTKISFLWYNVVGCLVVICAGVVFSRMFDRSAEPTGSSN